MNAAIIGMGKSGLAARRILEHNNISDITVFDDNVGNPISKFTDIFDLTVVSPGIEPGKIPNYPHNPTSEIELALKHMPAKSKIIAITGTDGKSTTTALANQILDAAGYHSVACGNFGYPLADAVLDNQSNTVFVLETSSFQLDLLQPYPMFDAACILNIAPDHLNRYKTIEKYAQSKNRIRQMLRHGAPFFDQANTPVADHTNFNLCGTHNKRNLDFAVAMCRAVVKLPDDLSQINKQLVGLEHRMEYIPTNNGIHYYNDSKATSIQAVSTALSAFESNVILMLGGQDKGLDFSPLTDITNKKCRTVILFGQDRYKIAKQLGGVHIPMQYAANLGMATAAACKLARIGDTVLLSPGCTSWDEFKSFEQRGRAFKQYVHDELTRHK